MSKSAPQGGQLSARDDHPSTAKLLQWLNRKGCIAAVMQRVDDKPRVRVSRQASNGVSEDVAEFDAACLQWLASNGWVIEEECGHWRISEAGRRKIAASRPVEKGTVPRNTDGHRHEAGTGAPNTISVNDSESPLMWLRCRRDRNGAPYISEAEFAAGERLRADFTLAQMTPRVTTNWHTAGAAAGWRGHPGFSVEISDRAAAAGQRVRHALAAVGPEFENILLDVCCFLKGLEQIEREARWPQRSAKIFLQMGLRALARHYRIGNPVNEGSRNGLRGIGTDTLDHGAQSI